MRRGSIGYYRKTFMKLSKGNGMHDCCLKKAIRRKNLKESHQFRHFSAMKMRMTHIYGMVDDMRRTLKSALVVQV